MRRFFTISLFLLLLLGACTGPKESQGDPYQLIPTSAVMVMQVPEVAALPAKAQESQVYADLQALEGLQNLDHYFKSLRSALDAKAWQDYWKDREAFFSLHLAGAKRYDWLYVSPSAPAFERRLAPALQEAGWTLERSPYAGFEIYAFQSPEGAHLHLANVENHLIASPSHTLVQAALRQQQAQYNLRQDSNFVRALSASNDGMPASLMLQLKKAPALLEKLLPAAQLPVLPELGSWAQMDLQTDPEQLYLSGIILPPTEEPSYLQVFRELATHRPESPAIVPAGAGFWLHLNIGNSGQYYRNYREYLRQKGQLDLHQQVLKKLPTPPAPVFESWVDNEAGIFQVGRQEGQSPRFAYFRYRGTSQRVEKSLRPYTDTQYVSGYRGYLIHQVKATNLLPRLYGQLFQDFHHPFYTVLDHFVLFAQSRAALKLVINDLKAGSTMKESETYQSVRQSLGDAGHLFVMGSAPEAQQLLHDLAPRSPAIGRSSPLQRLKWAGLQITARAEASYLTAALGHREQRQSPVNRQWSLSLPEQPTGEPQLVQNHMTGGYDVALQTKNNLLYLISHEGKVRWKVALDGPILGPIHQVDRYKNEHLQLVFNTARKVYMIDLLGRPVEGFPVELPRPASAPMGVFNYDQARQYRLLVPAGKRLLNYSIDGEPTPGWQFEEAGSPLVGAPQHFSVAGHDIIVCLSQSGKLYQLNRRGQERFQLEKQIPELKSRFYLKAAKTLKKSELLANSNSGQLYVIHPRGTAESLYLDPAKPADHFLYFQERYIFTHGPELVVKNPDAPFTVRLPKAISHRPKAYQRGSQFYLGAFTREAQQIYLYDAEGRAYPGFPVFAQGPFDMGSLRRNRTINLITYSLDGTVINYALR